MTTILGELSATAARTFLLKPADAMQLRNVLGRLPREQQAQTASLMRGLAVESEGWRG
jgi:hypothetical protein